MIPIKAALRGLLFTPDEWPCRLLSERHRDILILRLACDLIVNSDYSSIDRYAG